jgi:transcriptional regulator with XRE-family HTH domain
MQSRQQTNMSVVNDPRKKVGENVRRCRIKLGISQEELADRAELHRTYIGQVERGETNISLLNLVKLAGALEVTPKVLLTDV